MSTLSIRTSHVPQARWMPPSFARIVSFVDAVLDMVVEANGLASAARAHYPCAD